MTVQCEEEKPRRVERARADCEERWRSGGPEEEKEDRFRHKDGAERDHRQVQEEPDHRHRAEEARLNPRGPGRRPTALEEERPDTAPPGQERRPDLPVRAPVLTG